MSVEMDPRARNSLLRAQLKLYMHIASTERTGGDKNTRF